MNANLRVGSTSSHECATRTNGSGVDCNSQVGIHARPNLLPLPDLIVLSKVLIQMHFEVHVAQEAEAAVAALELDGLVELGYRNNINPKSKKSTS